MRLLLAVFVSIIGFQAHAEVPAHRVTTYKEFTIPSSFDAGGRVYYNCDSVESAVSDLLSTLGARHIAVRCTGGIEEGRPPMDAYVDVSFDALKLAASNDSGIVMANWTTISLNSWDDCYLKSQILEKTKDGFSMNNVSVRRCSEPGSQFRASLTTLF